MALAERSRDRARGVEVVSVAALSSCYFILNS